MEPCVFTEWGSLFCRFPFFKWWRWSLKANSSLAGVAWRRRYCWWCIFLFCFYSFSWGILVPWPGVETMPPAKSEKAMAPHSSTLAWKIPWMEEPGRLWSMGSLRVGHNRAASLSLFTFTHWRRNWQPTPLFLPGESQGRGSLVGCCLWGCTESDTTEVT